MRPVRNDGWNEQREEGREVLLPAGGGHGGGATHGWGGRMGDCQNRGFKSRPARRKGEMYHENERKRQVALFRSGRRRTIMDCMNYGITALTT